MLLPYLMESSIDLAKSDALRRLRPFLQQEPSRCRPEARAEREAAIRAYLADVVKAHLFALIEGQVLDPGMDIRAWLAEVLEGAVNYADGHAAVAAAADRHREELFDIVRSGFLTELRRRRRSWEAPGMGGVGMTPEMLAEEAEAKRELEEALARKKENRKALMPPSPEAPQLEPEPPPLAWDKDVSIIFLSEERVQAKRGDQFSTMNYAEFGFEDKRNGKPDQAWVILRAIAENKGVLQKPERRVPEAVLKPARDRDRELHRALEVQARQWAKTQKHVETIRKRLREHFQIPDGDPVPATAAGYQTAFQLGVSPSYKF
jgi:hypothetical protein